MKLIHVFTAPQSAYYFLDGQLEFMQSKGIEIIVVIPFDENYNKRFKKKHPNIRVKHINFDRRVNLINDFQCLMKFTNLLKSENPEVVHLHTPKASLIGVLAGRLLRKKNIIYQMHGLVSARGNSINKGLLYKMEKLTCTLASQIFAVSESLMEFAIENGLSKREKISVIENGTINGIDSINKFNPTILKQNILVKNKCKGKFVIGFVGRLSEEKGIFDYLNVLSIFKKDKIPFIGLIIGPDESNKLFYKEVTNNNLVLDKDIFVFGEKPDPENYMIHFDVLLLPTKREGFGLAGAEANALEKPVVGYDIPGFKDAVANNETGILVPFEDIDLLYKATKKYYDNPDLKILHGKNGRERVMSKFNSVKIWNSLFKKYVEMSKIS